MNARKSTSNFLNRILYFFPFQLVLLHIKRNHLLLIFWFLLLGYTGNFLASKYGVSYLFLYPEYLGQVGFTSFALTGFALGGFIMAFNIYTYIIHAHRFPFLATLSTPFYKFSINNFIIPAGFTFYYIFKSASFQYNAELESILNILINLSGFITGLLIFFVLSFLYFFKTNKNIDAYAIEKTPEEIEKKNTAPSLRSKGHWYYNQAGKRSWRVDSYLKNFFSMRLARNAKHYDKDLLRKVFYQNHINATIFEMLLIINFLLIGIFSDVELFILPGGASILLSFTFMLMVISVFLSWARGWTFTILVGLALVFNYFSSNDDFSFISNSLYGLDYKKTSVPYNEDVINTIDKNLITEDIKHNIKTLELWKKRVASGEEKPKLVIVNCSGGGLRAALWTCQSLAYADSLTGGKLLDHTVLFSGASGGMLGAAYVRELDYQATEKPWYNESEKIAKIGDDILNPLLLHLTTFDLFSGFRKFEWNGNKYPKDRAFSFEENLNKNTFNILDKPLSAYYDPVNKAEMPMMILSPTIVNDGRRMLISSQPIAYMTEYEHLSGPNTHNIENIEFSRLFKNHGAMDSRFSSSLRANATFPYILPQVEMPTDPEIILMDAGIRDNYGFKTSFQYVFAMKEWIEENTSGVVLLQVRDKSKTIYKRKDQSHSMFGKLLSPLGNLYNNFTRVHDFTHDQMLQELRSCVNLEIEEVYLEMSADKALNVSMSYHLTKKEKLIIKEGLTLKKNKQAFERIQSLLNE